MKNILSLLCMMLLAVCISSCGTKYARPDRCICDMTEVSASNDKADNEKASEANSQNSVNDEKATESASVAEEKTAPADQAQNQNAVAESAPATEQQVASVDQSANQNAVVAVAPVAEQETAKEEVAPETKAIQDSIQQAVKEGKKEFTIDFEKLAKQSLFQVNSDKIAEDSYKGLDIVATFLKETPNVTVKVEGHTDSTGAKEYNQKLSEKRAQSVANYLMEKGVDSSKITTEGFGPSKPIATNKTKEGRAQNRRTELKFKIGDVEQIEVMKSASGSAEVTK